MASMISLFASYTSQGAAAMTVTTLTTPSRRSAAPSPALAAGVYVGAWVVGLTAFGAGPGADATTAEVTAWYADHRLASALQSLSVHGVAAIALLGVLVAAHRSVRSNRVAHAAGVAGVVLSIVQLGLGLWRSAWSTGTMTADLVAAIDRLDGVKMLAFAVMIGAAVRGLRSAGLVGGRMARLGGAATVALAASGAGYLLDVAALETAAFVSLPLLLVWVGTLGIRVARTAH